MSVVPAVATKYLAKSNAQAQSQFLRRLCVCVFYNHTHYVERERASATGVVKKQHFADRISDQSAHRQEISRQEKSDDELPIPKYR